MKTDVSWEAVYFYKGWGFKHFTYTVYYNYHKSTNGHKFNRVNPEKREILCH